MSDEATKTIEIEEPKAPIESVVKTPTREDLKANGWSAKEMDAAEKRGMVKKPEEKKPKQEEPKAGPEENGTNPQEPQNKVEEKKPDEKLKSSLPDFTFKTPEQEKAFLDAFGAGTPQRAMYFRMKNERHARQAAEARNRELEARIQALESKSEPKRMEVDENGQEIDPDDKPLTPRQLREMRQKEAEEEAKQRQALEEKARIVSDAQRSQEEYARAVLPDFDDAVKMAKDVMQNLDAMVPEKWRQAKVIDLINKLQAAAANADRLGLDDYNAAFIAHEIGQFHPEYGKANGDKAEAHNDGKLERPETKANGGHTPEQMKRIEANTQRRASSASIPGGGGKRVISVDDVTLADLNRMSFDERTRFKEKHPEQYAKLLRG